MFMSIEKYGVFLNEQEADSFASEYLRRNPKEEVEDLFYGYQPYIAFVIDESYVSGSLGYYGNIEYIASGKTDVIPLGGFMLCLEKQGSAFEGSGELYSSLEEATKEIRSKWGIYLPEDFDYTEHLAQVNCARWV
jgi:hypothetical protein